MTESQIQRQALDMLGKFYGYRQFRPGQLEIITQICQGNDVTVLMPTGGGKSICYQLPALMLEGVAIVVSPLIALMHDQVTALQANGIPAAMLNSNMADTDMRRVEEHLYAGHIKILYMSPERVVEDIGRWSSDIKISFFAIDESHCISQWGHDFRPHYTRLSVLKERFPQLPVVALTATADRLTRDDIVKQLRLVSPFHYIASFDRPNISLTVMPAPTKAKCMNYIARMIDKYANDSGIVYCLSRKKAESVHQELLARGFRSVCYHAGMNASQRTASQRAFINGDAQVVCATVAFGMGIDKSNIRWVVHYNLPGNIESYYQEVGRAGRDGLPAEAVMFYSYADYMTRKNFADESGQKQVVEDKLERMKEYAEARVCRRRILLSYFNEETVHDCGNCDVCQHPPVRIDGSVLAQKAMSAILRTGSNIGMYMCIDILRGSARNDIAQAGYHMIKTYGAGRDLSQAEWQFYMLQMLQLGLIDLDYERGKKLSVTDYGREVLRGSRTVEFTKYEAPSRMEPRGRKSSVRNAQEAGSEKRLLEALKAIRLNEARKIGMPAYLIFSDATLADMAHKQPVTLEQFSLVSGVGENKLRRFGTLFVNAIRAFKGL